MGRQPVEVWQFSQGIVTGPWGLRVVCVCPAGREQVDRTGKGKGRADAGGTANRAQRANWSNVSVVVSVGAGRLGSARGLLKIPTIFWLGSNHEQLYDQTVLGQLVTTDKQAKYRKVRTAVQVRT